MTLLPRPAMRIALLGAIFMALLAFKIILPPDYPFFGAQIYDYYTRALLDGHWDLPIRALRIEGHYTQDGRGFLYHGLGPVLTRLPFAPFVEFPTTWISPLSIWAWAVAGNLCWHAAFAVGIERSALESASARNIAHLLLAASIWFAAPGMLLVASGTLYYEPVAMAYGLGGGVMLLVVLAWAGKLEARQVILPMAVLSGLAIHARPHLGLGFVVTTCLFALQVAIRGTTRERVRAGAAVVIVGMFCAVLLTSNAMRFGGITNMHGSFEAGKVQYGPVYWGLEDPQAARARSFTEHGRFHPGRMAPNLLVYLAALPDVQPTGTLNANLESVHSSLIAPFGRARIERPRAGLLFLWPIWIVMMCAALMHRETWRMPALAGMAGAGLGGALMLSYPTITLRYHVDLWPMIALPAALGLPHLLRWVDSSSLRTTLLIAFIMIGIGSTGIVVGQSRNLINEVPGSLPQAWSRSHCLEMVGTKGFAGATAERLCSLNEGGDVGHDQR